MARRKRRRTTRRRNPLRFPEGWFAVSVAYRKRSEAKKQMAKIRKMPTFRRAPLRVEPVTGQLGGGRYYVVFSSSRSPKYRGNPRRTRNASGWNGLRNIPGHKYGRYPNPSARSARSGRARRRNPTITAKKEGLNFYRVKLPGSVARGIKADYARHGYMVKLPSKGGSALFWASSGTAVKIPRWVLNIEPGKVQDWIWDNMKAAAAQIHYLNTRRKTVWP